MSLTERQKEIVESLAAQYHQAYGTELRSTKEILSYAHAIECILILERPNRQKLTAEASIKLFERILKWVLLNMITDDSEELAATHEIQRNTQEKISQVLEDLQTEDGPTEEINQPNLVKSLMIDCFGKNEIVRGKIIEHFKQIREFANYRINTDTEDQDQDQEMEKVSYSLAIRAMLIMWYEAASIPLDNGTIETLEKIGIILEELGRIGNDLATYEKEQAGNHPCFLMDSIHNPIDKINPEKIYSHAMKIRNELKSKLETIVDQLDPKPFTIESLLQSADFLFKIELTRAPEAIQNLYVTSTTPQ